MVDGNKNICGICGKNKTKGIEAESYICAECFVIVAYRLENGICSKCNEELPPGSRAIGIHLECENSKESYVGYD